MGLHFGDVSCCLSGMMISGRRMLLFFELRARAVLSKTSFSIRYQHTLSNVSTYLLFARRGSLSYASRHHCSNDSQYMTLLLATAHRL